MNNLGEKSLLSFLQNILDQQTRLIEAQNELLTQLHRLEAELEDLKTELIKKREGEERSKA